MPSLCLQACTYKSCEAQISFELPQSWFGSDSIHHSAQALVGSSPVISILCGRTSGWLSGPKETQDQQLAMVFISMTKHRLVSRLSVLQTRGGILTLPALPPKFLFCPCSGLFPHIYNKDLLSHTTLE